MQSSFIDTMESVHAEPHLWVPIARQRSSSHPLRIEIQLSSSLATAATEFLHSHGILCNAHHILRHLSIEPCYTLEHLYQSAIHTSQRKWLHIGECPLYPHVSLVEISCNVGSSFSRSAVNLTLTTFLHWGPGFIGNQGTLISFPNQFHIRI